MGSGANSTGYAEMWGGNVREFPDERQALGPGQIITWSDRIFPFRHIGGLTYAGTYLAARAAVVEGAAGIGDSFAVQVQMHTTDPFSNLSICVTVDAAVVACSDDFFSSPSQPINLTLPFPSPRNPPTNVLVLVRRKGNPLAQFPPD